MKARKWTALLLSLVLLLSLLLSLLPASALAADEETAETEAPAESVTEEAAAEDTEAEESSEPTLQDILDAASKKFDPDAIVATAYGKDITWRMYYYLIYSAMYQYFYYYGSVPDFTMDTGDGVSLGELLRQNMESRFIYYCAPQTKAEEAGVVDQVEAETEEQWNSLVEQYGGEEKLAESLEAEYLDKDAFLFLLKSNAAFNALMEESYGADGSKMTEDEVLEWANEQGYMRCKHILYLFTDDDGNELDDDAKAELLTTAEATVTELRALESDREAMLARFEEIMTEVGGDPGMTTFPDGYTFTDGSMVTEFEDGTKALAEYGISDVVETSYGYHVILRLPLDPDTATLSQNSGTGEYMTLREDAANEFFNAMITDWIEDGEVEWKNGFENLNYTALFTIDDADLLTGVDEVVETETTEETAEAEATEEPTEEAAAEETEPESKTNVWMYIAIAAVVIILALAAVIVGQRKQKKVEEPPETETGNTDSTEAELPDSENTETADFAEAAGTETEISAEDTTTETEETKEE